MLPTRIHGGAVCRECRQYIPSWVLLRSAEAGFLKDMIKASKEKADIFEATSCYGCLYLDSIHHMVCYSKKKKGGEPKSFGDIYYLTELSELTLYMANVRNTRQDRIDARCDVKMRIASGTDGKQAVREYLIAAGEPCRTGEESGGKVQCFEPPELPVMRSLIMQMIEDINHSFEKELLRMQGLRELAEKSKEQAEEEWARGILFLSNEQHTPEEVKAQYRMMCRMFHPDLHPDLPDEYVQRINAAYKILK